MLNHPGVRNLLPHYCAALEKSRQVAFLSSTFQSSLRKLKKVSLSTSDDEIYFAGAKQEITKKYQPGEMDNLGFSYDLHSIMQYEKTAFAKSEGLVTMEAKSDPNIELGNQNAMSAADIMKINKLYQCPGNGDLCK